MSAGSPRGHVTLEPRRLWSLRISLGATRWVLYAVALCGVLATARNAIAPPLQRLVAVETPRASDADAQWLALRFVRAYLTWSADPLVQERSLAPFLGFADDPDAGMTPAVGSSEQVRWVAIAGARSLPGGEQDYTVAADTGRGTVRYVEIVLRRGPHGGEVLAHYPAFVAAPAPERAPPGRTPGPARR